MSSKNGWLYEISFMRPILLVLLVSYHAFAPYCGAWQMPEGVESNIFYKWLGLFSRAFRLEAFVFVSGYIFALQIIKKNKFGSFIDLVKSKFIRLIIPCWVFGLFYWFLFRTTEITHVLTGVGHLWYLPTLFWCFFVGYLLYKRTYSPIRVWICLLILLMVSFVPLPFQLGRAMYYIFFFYMGGIFWKYSSLLSEKATLKNIFQQAFLWGLQKSKALPYSL